MKLRDIFPVKLKTVADRAMGVPHQWLKEDLHELLSAVDYKPRLRASEEVIDPKLNDSYPAELLPTLLMYRTPNDLFIFARRWTHCANVWPEKYGIAAKSRQIEQMLDYGKWTNVFALTAWRAGHYVPTKVDWQDFKRATR